MPEAVTAMVQTTGKYIDFTPEEIASATKIAAKLAYLNKDNLIFIDGFITGAIMRGEGADDIHT